MTTQAPPAALELSCYTTTLVEYLDRTCQVPAAGRLAHAVHLSVRTDLPTGLAFSHHERIDVTADGEALVYRSALRWEDAHRSLANEVDARGAVVAVANARYLPWSPHHGVADVPHWILVVDCAGEGWEVSDRFAALLPRGAQHPWCGHLDDAQLREALTPMPGLEPELVLREVHALGAAVPLPPLGHYRWLEMAASEHPRRPPAGTWLHHPIDALTCLAQRLSTEEEDLARHADDLWAAARHHQHRIRVLVGENLLPKGAGRDAAASWAALPRALRFAALSAARGRPRPGGVTRAFDDVLQAMQRFAPHQRRAVSTTPSPAVGGAAR